MKDEDIQKAVKAIALIAASQADLVENANASPAHTTLVLKEIAERCAAIKPSKRFRGGDEIDDQLKKLVEGAVGFCEATSEEVSSIWSRLVEHRHPAVTWRQHGGVGVTIGYLDERPVHVGLSHIDVAGHKVIFYDATSTVVDHDMVRAFIDALAPESARRGDRVNHADASNMTNILPHAWQTEGVAS